MATILKRPVKRVKITGFKPFQKKHEEPKVSTSEVETTVSVPVQKAVEPIEEPKKKKRAKKTNKKQDN